MSHFTTTARIASARFDVDIAFLRAHARAEGLVDGAYFAAVDPQTGDTLVVADGSTLADLAEAVARETPTNAVPVAFPRDPA